MASIKFEERKNGSRYHVRIRKKNYPRLTVNFETREEAETFVIEHQERYFKNPNPYLRIIEIKRLFDFKAPYRLSMFDSHNLKKYNG